MKAKVTQGGRGPLCGSKESPAQRLAQHGASCEGPTPAKTARQGQQQGQARSQQGSTVSKNRPMSHLTSGPRWHSDGEHLSGVMGITGNENEPMSPLTSGVRLYSDKGHASGAEGTGSSGGAARGSGSTEEGSRADFPLNWTEGGRAGVDEPEHDSDAMARVLRETHTATSRKSIRGRRVWWEARAERRGFEPYPLDHFKLKLAAGLLKSGQYRSAGQCLYTIKKAHVEQGFEWKPDLDALLGDLRRSCARGLGGTRQAAPLPIGLMSTAQRFCSAEWPRGLEAILVGSWWLLREVELASLRKEDIRFTEGQGCGSAELTVRASKADTEAAGCTCAHACTCPAVICPVKAARALTQGLEAGERVLQDKDGRGLSKKDTIRLLKSFCGVARRRPYADHWPLTADHWRATTG